ARVAARVRRGGRMGGPGGWRRGGGGGGRRRGGWWRGRPRRPITPKFALRDPPSRVGVHVAWLTQDQREFSDIAREQDLLCLLSRDFDCDRLGNCRLLLPLACQLVDREHLHVVQKDF